MSRRVCETCQWFATGNLGCMYDYGICTYKDRTAPMSPDDAADQIRNEEDWCKHWERKGEYEHE